jgi:PTS system nitrogen regulatory IIA component
MNWKIIQALGQHQHQRKPPPPVHSISDLLSPENILLDVAATSKRDLLELIGKHIEKTHELARGVVASNLAHRERIGSTGLGEGVAIPHARVANLDHIVAAYVRLAAPIDFDAPDGRPVVDVLVLLVPKQATEEHLLILSEATQLLSGRRFRERLHGCPDAAAASTLFSN